MTDEYDLRCTECDFEPYVEDVEAALDVARSHRNEAGEDHFVDIYRSGYGPDDDSGDSQGTGSAPGF